MKPTTLKIGDKITLKQSYNGYFRHLKGLTLTVKCIEDNYLMVNEIKIGHLILCDNVKKVIVKRRKK